MGILQKIAAARTPARGRKGWSQPPFWAADNLRAPFLSSYPLRPDRETIENDFEGYVRQAFKANGIVFACVLARQMVFAEARFQWRTFTDGRPGNLFGTDELSLLEKPWPGGTIGELLSRMEQDGSLAGNFWATTADDAGNLGRAATGPGRRIAHMRPDRVTMLIGSKEDGAGSPNALDARVIGILHKAPATGEHDAVETLLLPGEYCHFSPIPDPEARFRGMSWLTPILREIQSDSASTVHKGRFFENAAVPNLVVKFDKDAEDDSFEEFVEKFNAQHKGAWNSYKCLHPETEVALWNGARSRADDVEPGDVVVSWADGKPVPGLVSRVEEQPASPIVEITTGRGRIIKTNEPHPFLTSRGWVAAGDLLPGDRLTTGLGWGRPRLQDSLSPSDAWLLGVLTGDGSLVGSTPVVSVADPDILRHLRAMATLKKTMNPRGPYDYRVLGVSALINASGMKGKRSWEKAVPLAVMTGGTEVVCSFIAGLIDSDGHVTDPDAGGGEVGITSTSRRLLSDVQHLLASLDVNASISQPPSMKVDAPGGGSGAARRHDGYRLHVFGNIQAARLDELLTLRHAEKARRLREHAKRPSSQDRSRFDRVKTVRLLPAEQTIGIEVAGHHTHVTGGVVSHNTLFLAGGADVTPLTMDFKQLDFGNVVGKGESRIASAAGVPPSWVGFSEGLQGSALNAGNFNSARRRFADGTIKPLWRMAAASLQQILTPPSRAELAPDFRDVAFLREDQTDVAEIQSKQAVALRALTDAGFNPDAAVRYLTTDDLEQLIGHHSGLFSVQLMPPNQDAPVAESADNSLTITDVEKAATLITAGWKVVSRPDRSAA